MKPAFKVIADGADITAQIADRLLQLRVTDNAGQQSDSLEISLDDRGALVPLPASGSWLRVWVGYSEGGTQPAYMGAFAVDECDLSNGPRSLVIKATASNTAPRLVREQRTQSWHNTTLGQIINEIAQRNGLQPVIKGDLGKIQIKHEDQTNESDQSFLTRLAEKYKATIKPADGTLTAVIRGAGAGGGLFAIKQTEVTNWRATIKSRGAYGGATARYLDRKSNKELTVTAGEKSGPLPVFEDKQLFRNKDEAEKAAASRLQALRSGEVRINLSMPGRPDINAEGLVSLTGFQPEVDGTWVVMSVTHDVGSGGYVTSVECGTQGEEANDWSSGSDGSRGRNNGRPPTEKARIIADAAASSRGMNTRGGPDGGNNACVYAVNRVLRRAGISPPWGSSNYVPTARAALAGGAGTRLAGPEPGAIVIFRDNGSPPYPHIGIVQSNGSIISNSSSRGSFSWVASPSSYTSYYGRTPEYWRLE